MKNKVINKVLIKIKIAVRKDISCFYSINNYESSIFYPFGRFTNFSV